MTISIEELEALHRKYAPSDETFDLVFTHCLIVRDIAIALASKSNLKLDMQLVETGAMLHDIGVYPLFGIDNKLKPGANYIRHGIEGEKILKNENLPIAVQRIASHHTGVGLTKHDIRTQKLALPERDLLAETDEELLVMYADKFHSKTEPPFFNSFEWYSNFISKFGDDKKSEFESMAEKFGKPNLEPFIEKYGHELR